jgi:hypothetical protein
MVGLKCMPWASIRSLLEGGVWRGVKFYAGSLGTITLRYQSLAGRHLSRSALRGSLSSLHIRFGSSWTLTVDKREPCAMFTRAFG